MTLNKDAPWWAKLTANSALMLIAFAAIWTLRLDVQASLADIESEHRVFAQVLDGHVIEWRQGQRDLVQMLRAQCLNAAETWIEMQNCVSPSEAVWPEQVGAKAPQVRPPTRRRLAPTFPGITVN